MAVYDNQEGRELDSPGRIVGVDRGGLGASFGALGPGFAYQSALGDEFESVPIHSVIGVVDVATYKTGGTGTNADPWTGWDAATPWSDGGSYWFRGGVFETSGLNLRGKKRFRLFGVGPGSSFIRGTGSGAVITLGADAATVYRVMIDGLRIMSTGTCTNGIELESVHHSVLRNLLITDITNAAVFWDFGVNDKIEDVFATSAGGTQTVVPAYGLYLRCLDPGNTSGTTIKVLGGEFSNTTVAAVHLDKMVGGLFDGVVVEGNTGRGLVVSSGSERNIFNGFHAEANTGINIEVDSPGNTFINCFSDAEFNLDGSRNVVIGGDLNLVQITGNYNHLTDVRYALDGGGGYTDSGAGNVKIRCAPAGTSIPDLSEHGPLAVFGPNAIINDTQSLIVRTTDAFAQNKGGGITLMGKYNTAGAYAGYGGIVARKENGTDGDYSGYVALASNNGSSGTVEGMRIDSKQVASFPGSVKYVTSQFDKTSDTTLANVTGLSVNVLAGGKRRFEANLYCSSNASGGVKFAIGGTATATSIIYEAALFSAGVSTAVGTARATALGTAVADITAVAAGRVVITGTMVVANAGTLTLQMAQNASFATASSVLVGSTFSVWGS